MATILDPETAKKMKSFRPIDKTREEIKGALENLRKVLNKHHCIAYLDQVCCELHVFYRKKGMTYTVQDRDDGEPSDGIQCLGAYLFTPIEAVINAEHDIVWATKK